MLCQERDQPAFQIRSLVGVCHFKTNEGEPFAQGAADHDLMLRVTFSLGVIPVGKVRVIKVNPPEQGTAYVFPEDASILVAPLRVHLAIVLPNPLPEAVVSAMCPDSNDPVDRSTIDYYPLTCLKKQVDAVSRQFGVDNWVADTRQLTNEVVNVTSSVAEITHLVVLPRTAPVPNPPI
jgi:hypothetical protein